MNMKKSALALSLILGLLGVAAAVGVASLVTSDNVVPGTTVASSPTVETAAPDEIAASLRADFGGVFGRPAAQSDELPAALVGRLSAASVKMNPGLARQIIALDSGLSLYLIPAARDRVCLVDQTGSGGCSRISEVRTYGIVMTDECSAAADKGNLLVYGVVPDAVHSVQLVTADGESTQVAVGGNAWHAEAPRRGDGSPREVRWTDGGDVQRVAMPAPSSSGNC